MVKAIIDVKGETNQVLNIIKAKYGLKDKSKAIDKMAEEYSEKLLEMELRPKVIEAFKPENTNNSDNSEQKEVEE